MYEEGEVMKVANQKPADMQRKCGKCHWYWHGWCDCLFGQHDKEQRADYDEACGDWASKDARVGVLACGDIWMEVE
ncbi:MAG: hypothetical protein M0R22_01265 [Dehalococcoidia bacterium]|nr:hypothetical protein [Dehalococcoidia bacterium]